MKKVIRILLLLSILCLSGCDFLRKVAGRPTGADLEAKAEYIEQRRQKEIADSIMAEQEALLASRIQDSVETAGASRAIDSLGVRMSSVFRFGQPVEDLEYQYNLIIGVFRNKRIADAKCVEAADYGFSPFLIPFSGGVNALCLCASDALKDVVNSYVSGCATGICPRDAWVYVNEMAAEQPDGQ